jgi:hypothetical protein
MYRRVALLAAAFLALPLTVHAAGPTLLADRGTPFGPFATAPVPTGGHLLVWQGPWSDTGVPLHALRVDARGFPAESLGVVSLLTNSVSSLDVAVAASGRFAVVWNEPDGADQVGVNGSLFEPDGTLVRYLDFPEPVEPQFTSWASGFGGRVAAVPDGGFVATWTVGWSEDFITDPLSPNLSAPHLIAITADGQLGEPVRLSLSETRGNGHGKVLASEGGVLVTWTEDETVFGRLFELEPDLTPRTDRIELPAMPFAAHDAVLGPAGRFLLAATVDDEILVQRYDRDGREIGNPEPLDLPAGPLDLGATSDGRLWLLTTRDDGQGSTSRVLLELDFETLRIVADSPVGDADRVELSTSGSSPLVAWTVAGQAALIMGQVFGAADTLLPDADLALTSPELPGFRVWVRITGQGLPSIWGTEIARCLDNALCAAGALPDQAEVIVRVAGPKPNGFLWPTINKLSTSRVEVWIEQIATGDRQFYLLPGASPGTSVLPGLFDRRGFEPF